MTIFLALMLSTALPAGAAKTPCPQGIERRVGPCTANSEEQREIMGYIQSGVRAHADYEKAVEEETRLRRRTESIAHLWGTEEYYLALKAWSTAQEDVEKAKDKMDTNFKAAIEKAQLYYGLKRGPGRIENGPLAGRSADWAPRFVYASKNEAGAYELVVRKSEQSAGGKPYFVPVQFTKDDEGATAASIDEDGGVNISIDAFRNAQKARNPGHLAKSLFHERVHFDDLGIKGGWDSREKLEVHAYDEVLKKAAVFEMDEKYLRIIRQEKIMWMRERDKVERGVKAPTAPYPATVAERERMQGLLSRRFEYDRERMDAIRRGQAELKGRLAAEQGVRSPARYPEMGSLHAYDFKAAAAQACDADKPSSDWLPYIRDKQWFPRVDGYVPGMADDLDGCAKDLWTMFVGSREGLMERGLSGAIIEPEKLVRLAERTRRYYLPSMGTQVLAVLVEKACAGPGNVTEGDLKPLEELTFPNPRITFLSAESMPSMAGCRRELYETIRGFNRTWRRSTRLNAGWLNWEASRLVEKYRPPEAPVKPPAAGSEPERWRGKPIDLPTLDEILRRL